MRLPRLVMTLVFNSGGSKQFPFRLYSYGWMMSGQALPRPGQARIHNRRAVGRSGPADPPALRRQWVAVIVAAGSGLLLDLSFPSVGWWPLAPIALAGLCGALYGRSIVAGTVLGFVFGLGFFVPHVAWSGTYVGAMPWLVLATAESLFLAAFGAAVALTARATQRTAPHALAFGSLWVGQEALRARVPFGGFPWGRVAFSQTEAPTLGLAALGGAPLVSFAVALAGALVFQAVIDALPSKHHQRWSATGRLAAAIGAVSAMAVGTAVPAPSGADEYATVAAVQGNVPRPGLAFNAERRAVLENHAAATRRLARQVAGGRRAPPDLVLWPENSSDIDPLRNPDAAAVIAQAVDAIGVPVLVGAVLQEPAGRLSNAGIVWQPRSGPGPRYVKHRPAPFAEYIPYRFFFRTLTDKVDLVGRDFVGGTGQNVLPMGPATVGMAICFEVAFDDLLRRAVAQGANLLAVQTNNATFGRTDESVQQLAMSRLRAVEHGRSVVHVSTVGVSALIRPDGVVADTSRLFTPAVLSASLPLRRELTVATRVGGWPEAMLSLVGLGYLVIGAANRRRAQHRETVHTQRLRTDDFAGTMRGT